MSRGERSAGFDPFALSESRRILSVSELTGELKDLIEGNFPRLWVSGEVSGCRRQASGHFYLTLKDDKASLQAVLFRSQARHLRFDLKDGMEVLAVGRLSLYSPRGQYQLVVEHVEPKGLGALHAAFEKMRRRLEKEGLFDSNRKTAIPKLPAAIGVVTSPTGAAIYDFLRVLRRRNPNVRVLIAPAKVQGEGAANEIAIQLARLDARGDLDVLVITRGGGSIEDLWAFNEEILARAIAACKTPVVSAVGHEVDISIADLVADLRAPTPSAAAEMLVPEHSEMTRELIGLRERLTSSIRMQLRQRRALLMAFSKAFADPRKLVIDRRLDLEQMRSRTDGAMSFFLRQRQRLFMREKACIERLHPRLKLQRMRKDLLAREGRLLKAIEARLSLSRLNIRSISDSLQGYHPWPRIDRERRKMAHIWTRMTTIAARNISDKRQIHAGLGGKLDALSPLRILDRGYAIVKSERGFFVRAASDLRQGEKLDIRVAKAIVRARVIDVEALEHSAEKESASEKSSL